VLTQTKSSDRPTSAQAAPARAHAGIHQAPALQHGIGFLGAQQFAGNLAVQRLFNAGALQAKLSVSHPDDPYEQEADRVADQIMRVPEPQLQRACACGGSCLSCQAEQTGQELLQTKSLGPIGLEQASVPSVDHVLRSSSDPLDATTRSFMEHRFGQDFSGVRVHADAAAEQSAREINAEAYTVGHDIVFAADRYAPGTRDGSRLLAHELTHVLQQGGANRAHRTANHATDSGRHATVETSVGVAPMSDSRTDVIQRQPRAPSPGLTRSEEIRLSMTSPGEVAVALNPPTLSIYNFPIDRATLKKEHLIVLLVISKLIKASCGKLGIEASGHADSTGDDEKVNIPLSKNRVLAARTALGVPADVPDTWFGEDQPVTTNGTVEGRSRNRRVDIVLSPKAVDWPSLCELAPTICLCISNPVLCLGGDGDGDGDGIDWPSCSDLPAWVCPILVCIGASAILRNPTLCLPGLPTLTGILCLLFPSLCRHKPEPPEEPKEKARKACPVSTQLPEGKKVIDTTQPFVDYPFDMKVVFQQESPDKSPYCDCNCGEYRQYVSGFFERDDETGKVKRPRHVIAWGKVLHPNVMQEDGPDPYGHRYDENLARARTGKNVRRLTKDAARPFLRENREGIKTPTNPQAVFDRFAPDREDGCTYEGKDSPGFRYSPLAEEIHMHLKFRAGPIDACNGNREVGEWKEWEIIADRVPKPTPPAARAPIVCAGLPPGVKEGDVVTMWIAFEGQEAECSGTIPVTILSLTATELMVFTHNSDRINIAPEDCPDMWIAPYQTFTFFGSPPCPPVA
jgi:outer membrane protein OmpA-like peptidoglycan-associated protein